MKRYFHLKAVLTGSFLFFFFAITQHLIAQPQLAWAQKFGSDAAIQSADVDQQGNIYFSGTFFGITDFDNSVSGAFFLNDVNGHGFVVKVSAAGVFQWAAQFHVQHSPKVKLDQNGNLYVCGNTHETNPIDLDPGPGQVLHDNITPGYADMYIVKLDENGHYIWGHAMGGDYLDNISDVTTDPVDNSVYIWGDFYGTGDFDPGPDTYLIGSGGFTQYILKLDADGQFSAAYANDKVFMQGIQARSNGGLIAYGSFNDTIDFDPGVEIHELSTDVYSGFILNLTPAGAFESVKKAAQPLSLEAWSGAADITFDPSGNMYMAGNYGGDLDFDPGPGVLSLPYEQGKQHFFVLKYSPSGALLWAIGYSQSGSAYGPSSIRMVASPQGSLYIAGTIEGTWDFDAGPGQSNITSIGEFDMFMLKLLPDGQFGWVVRIGGTSYDYCTALNLDSNNQLFASGIFNGAVDFDPGPGVKNLSAGVGFGSGFVAKYSGVSGAYQPESLESVSVNPNPATEWIKIPAGVEAETYAIYNELGVLSAGGRITDKNEEINVSDLPSGHYVICFTGEKKQYIGKFLKVQDR